ncbi:MAG TPA: beta-propeller fold lactonase family protein [Terracidiphilus sp.]|jgi:6-phosphogluconolactonase (cycloisomerase 2 family)|nr:beta-propeller fold lactonase family protein [Terracidiphilus sp.]
MKFTKFGKTLLMIAISAGVIVGITSCVQSYSVGYLYVTGTNNSGSSNNGIISGFKIDHNKGLLTAIHGTPVSSGGANPGRAVLLTGGRFIYVLNRGKNSAGTADCTLADQCGGANISEFSIGGNGVLAPQGQAFFSQGINPIRLIADTSGNFLYVLDQIAPDSSTCALALGSSVTSCGDITAFKIDANTGRLTLVVNAQVSSANGQALPYFPVPANPIDFVLASSYILTLSGTPGTGDAVFPYTYAAATGQLTVNQNSAQPLNIAKATSIVAAGGDVYVLDNEPGTFNANGSTVTAPGWIFPFTVGANGALQQTSGGAVPDDVALTNPVYLVLESKGKWLYVVNAGNNDTSSANSASGIAGYVIDPATHYPSEIPGSPWGTGSGPQCMLEDPSSQFLYTANFNDATVTGRSIDQNSGVLNNLPGSANKSYPLSGPAAWCIATGRTS